MKALLLALHLLFGLPLPQKPMHKVGPPEYAGDLTVRLGVCQYQIRLIDLGYDVIVVVKWSCPWKGVGN